MRVIAAGLPLVYAGASIFLFNSSIATVLILTAITFVIELYLWVQIGKEEKSFKDKLQTLLPFGMVLVGSFGLVASINLTVEEIKMLQDTEHIASCTISPIVSCTSSINSDQGRVLGPPNPVLGTAAFGALLAVAFGMLAGARYQLWFWQAIWFGGLLGILSVVWFIWQALYVLGALCIYCMMTWTIIIPLFYYLTLHGLVRGHIRAPKQFRSFLEQYHLVAVTATYGIILVLIYFRFSEYWNSLI